MPAGTDEAIETNRCFELSLPDEKELTRKATQNEE